MQRNITIFISFQCFCLLLLLSHAIYARPNPVPNDDLNPDLELQHYEKEDNKLTAADRVRHQYREVRAPEDEEDQEVINELPMLQTIRRRNRDIYSVRPNIFQPYIDNWAPEREESKQHQRER